MTRSFPLSPLAAALALAIAAPAAASPSATDLDRVQVHGQRDSYRSAETRTATRTDTPLIDVPQSITVVTDEMMEDTAMRGLADVVQYVPGAGIAQGEGHRDAPVLRGNTSTADLFVDGMRDDVQYIRDLYNVERVEILKGPNAMVFGRGGTGGVVNRVTKQAQWDTVRAFSLQAGSWERRRATADVGQAINDMVAFRVTALYEDSGSFRDAFGIERWGVNPSLAIRAGENTHVHVDFEHFEDDRTTDRGFPSYPNAFQGRRLPVDADRSMFFGDPDASFASAEVDALNVLVEHDFGDDVVLRNRTRYADYSKFYQNVFAAGPVRVDPVSGTPVVALTGYNNATERTNLFNQTDLVFTAEAGATRHTVLVGAEFGRQESDNFRNTASFAPNTCYDDAGAFAGTTSRFCVPYADPMVDTPVSFAQSASDADNNVVARVAALYAQDQIEFSERWQAVLGVRFDRFEVDLRNNRTGARVSQQDDLWSPRAGLIFKPQENLSLYASYGITYEPRSGEQMSSLSDSNRSLDPEEFRNLEVGAKWDITPELAFTVAVFRLDRDNVIQPDPDDATRNILGDGERIEGVELGIAGQITDAWRVMGGVAWQDGEILFGSNRGHAPSNLPERTASLWNRYDFNAQWGVGFGIVHRGEMYASTGNDVVLKGYTRYDAAVYYAPTERLEFQLNLENLSDKRYFLNAHNDNNISPGSPLAAYLTVRVAF